MSTAIQILNLLEQSSSESEFSLKELAEQLGKEISTVSMAAKKLKANGNISMDRRKIIDGKTRFKTYIRLSTSDILKFKTEVQNKIEPQIEAKTVEKQEIGHLTNQVKTLQNEHLLLKEENKKLVQSLHKATEKNDTTFDDWVITQRQQVDYKMEKIIKFMEKNQKKYSDTRKGEIVAKTKYTAREVETRLRKLLAQNIIRLNRELKNSPKYGYILVI